MANAFEIAIVGGGLSGLTAALHLAEAGHAVVLFEKGELPRHKVCGEYVSKETVDYLNSLGVRLSDLTDVSIDQLKLSNRRGWYTTKNLKLGGVGISRFLLEKAILDRVIHLGVEVFQKTQVNQIKTHNNGYSVHLPGGVIFTAKAVLGSYGKRSNIQKDKLKRSSYFAVKQHFQLPDFPSEQVQLNFFEGGYAGISKVEGNKVNFCYLANNKSLKQWGSLPMFEEMVLKQNPLIAEFLSNAEPVFEKPLSISQIYFGERQSVLDEVPQLGDAGGMIYPLSGNGMSIAIHTALIASELASSYCKGQLSKQEFVLSYAQAWQSRFGFRIQASRFYQELVNTSFGQDLAIGFMSVPLLSEWIVQSTHGKTRELEALYAG